VLRAESACVSKESVDFSFGKQARLLTPQAFKWVFSRAQRLSCGYFTLLHRKQTLGHPRLGLVIAKKSLKRSVDRNRFKRICRDQFRQYQHLLSSRDMVIISRKPLKQFESQKLHQQLNQLFQELSQS